MDEKPESQFKLIEGDWVEAPGWLDFPKTVSAPSPQDRSELFDLRISRSDLLKAADARRRQPAYQLWSVILGRVPPVPGAPDDIKGLTDLTHAHACFAGLKRGCGADDDGDGFLAYVLKPACFYSFRPRPPLVFTEKKELAPDLVFMAYARLDHPPGTKGTCGVLTHWEFVKADETDCMLPDEYKSRYREQLW